MKKWKTWKRLLIGLVLILVIGLAWGVNYLFNYALVPSKKDFIGPTIPISQAQEEYHRWKLTDKEHKMQTLNLTSRDHLKLKAAYFTQKQSTKTPRLAIIAHGYSASSLDMGKYAKMFHKMGYDLLLPDARAHGRSEGKYIGFGWPERLDYVDWIQKMIKLYDGNVEICLFGVSMGGATVMMTSGEKLPKQVKAIIEDCGYVSVEQELTYQLKELFHLPKFPMIPLASMYAKVRAGYSFSEANSVKQLAKNQLPMLFIHGAEDKFVPTKDIYQVYKATKGPKQRYIVKGAAHARSYETNPKKYQQVVKNFLDKYMPVPNN